MSLDVSKSNVDRQAVLLDEKQRILDLTSFNFTPPAVGIYDEPTRCYRANIQWAKIIEGFLDWLADVAAWKDAQDDNYVAIQAMLQFLEGTDCDMPIDCEEVEACLVTSPTIEEINDNIGGLADQNDGGYNPENVSKPINEGKNYPDTQTPIAPPANSCDDSDKDKLWGAIDAFVDYCHNKNLDFVQNMQQAISLNDGIQRALEIIPLVENLPPSNLADFIRWQVDFLLDSYNAEVTTDGLYEVKCYLFCAALDAGCNFTVGDALSYFLSDSGLGVTLSGNILDVMNGLSGLIGLSGMQWFSALTVLQLSIASLGEVFVKASNIKNYIKSAEAGALAGSSAWNVWCEECGVEPASWTVVFDFTGGYSALPGEIVYRPPHNLQPLGAQATDSTVTQSASGLRFVSPVNGNGVRRTIGMQAPFNIDTVQWRARSIAGYASLTDFRVQSPGNGSGTGLLGTQFIPPAGAYVDSAVLNQNAALTHVGIISQTATGGTYAGDIAWLKLTGTGQIPIPA